ncbi:glycoside hydrolase family protein [Chitinilyticum aquatile]|uniref:glycoside hydrolase family protein n=1 Tax=Chitinilyticum aquatile TaxID=362520 RepID=UPI000419D5A0|nr:glycoside hydrolase family protein [Chitinilyticum aquatile]
MTSAADPFGLYDWFKPDEKSPSSYDAGSGTKVAPTGIYEWFTEAMNKSIVAPDGLYPWLDERTQQVKQDWSNWSTVVAMPTEILQKFYEWFKGIAQTVWAEVQRIAAMFATAAGGLVGGGVNMRSTKSLARAITIWEAAGPESPKLKPYIRPESKTGAAGGYAIGFGHNIRGTKAGEQKLDMWMMNGITTEQAWEWLYKDLEFFNDWVNERLRNKNLNQAQYDALINLAFGLGEVNRAKAIAIANSGDTEKMLRFMAFRTGPSAANPMGGLIKRRSIDIAAWISGGDFQWPKDAAEMEAMAVSYRHLWNKYRAMGDV